MGGGGECAARLFLLFSFYCSADHERDWPPCKVVFRVGNQYAECDKQQQLLLKGKIRVVRAPETNKLRQINYRPYRTRYEL